MNRYFGDFDAVLEFDAPKDFTLDVIFGPRSTSSGSSFGAPTGHHRLHNSNRFHVVHLIGLLLIALGVGMERRLVLP